MHHFRGTEILFPGVIYGTRDVEGDVTAPFRAHGTDPPGKGFGAPLRRC